MTATLIPSARHRIAVAGARPSPPISVAVIGCGAVVRDFHLPVLAGHESIRIAALIDRNLDSARELAKAYAVDTVLADVGQLVDHEIDAALIATPPCFHAPVAIGLLRRGIHVLVEKPMATNLADAQEMVKAAVDGDSVLSVGHFRRLFPSTRMLAALILTQKYGRILSFDVEEGHIFDWPLVSLSGMTKVHAGGGVLIDTGSHTIDQLLACLPGAPTLIEYCDNSLGGIESDCVLRLRIDHLGQPVEGRIELSRTRRLRNTMRIECENAILELAFDDCERVCIQPKNLLLNDPLEEFGDFHLRANWIGERQSDILASFRAEIDDWWQAIQTKSSPCLSGSSVLPTVSLIDDCYRNVQSLTEPWRRDDPLLARTLRSVVSMREGKLPQADSEPPIVKSTRQKVLVTGAAGFIGCRTAELLHLSGDWDVRALVHRPGGASRLARLPIQLIHGDLRNVEQVQQAVADCDAVVHCAYGTSWVSRKDVYDVTVGGTRSLVEAARQAGVKRFVHLSTVAIHGPDIHDTFDEETPIRPPRHDHYARSKALAEAVVSEAARRGLGTVTLRLTNVYGPYSGPYTIRPVTHLLQGMAVLVGDGRAPSNTVFVDNVVYAIACSLSADNGIRGATFTINDDDGTTWAQFHNVLAKALKTDALSVSTEDYERIRHTQTGRWNPWAWGRQCARSVVDLVRSSEFREFAAKTVQSDPLGYLPRQLLGNLPWVRNHIRRALALDQPKSFRLSAIRKSQLPDLGLMNVYTLPIQAAANNARSRLGYRSVVSREQAYAQTIAWLNWSRLVPR